MKKLYGHRFLLSALFPALLCAAASFHVAQANTDRVIIDNGNNALSNEQASQDKEQWNATRSLRNKVNSRVEKEFDKKDKAFDERDACEKSSNINAYWEPNTERCLDRHTGQKITP